MAVPLAIISDLQEFQLDNAGSFIDAATTDRRPDVLIGMDQLHYFQIVVEKQLGNGYHLSRSILGPIVSGLGSSPTQTVDLANMFVSSLAIDTPTKYSDELFNLVQNHFELEKSCIEEKEAEETEEYLIKQFEQSLKFVEGRYEVALPWKKPMPQLNSNYWLARGRLRSTMKMLRQKPALLAQYHQIMTEQLEKGIIEIVQPGEINQGNVTHYLPHQAVIREDKLHTKLRIVYDGSAKTGRASASINQCLHRGPVLLSDLIGILLRFRLPKICIVADIEKAFLQLSVVSQDRDACRFLWPDNPQSEKWEESLNIYRFCRVTFGLICSPFLLAATIKEHLRRNGTPLAKNILDNIYVDNVIMHAGSNDDVFSLCNKAREIFLAASMNLREFASNDRTSMSMLPTSDRLPSSEVKVLGVRWDTEKDILRMIPKAGTTGGWTKRSVLTLIASIFDPMGLLTPAMLNAKLFFQNLWKERLSWDEPLPNGLEQEFVKIINDWNTEIIVPRRLFSGECGEYELHVFSNASGNAFGAAAYLCSISNSTKEARLIFSKCRVKSLNCQTTIPKLELQALTLAAKMVIFLTKLLPINKVQLWTDSQCVIHWLNSSTKLERYVENRVNIIRDYAVNYVNTSENPADLITRGITFQMLADCNKWWSGPAWLNGSANTSFEGAPAYNPEEYAQRSEKLPEAIQTFCLAIPTENVDNSIIALERFSNWRTATRTTAYVLHFLDIVRKRALRGSPLYAYDIERARITLLKEAQRRQPPNSDAKKSLALFIEEDIWRCQGRIGESYATDDIKQPIWLPPQDRVTALIVQSEHEAANHAGSTITLSRLRQQYWLPQGRRRVRCLIRKNCFKCRKFEVFPYKLPLLPNLPQTRVVRSRPFENTGLDYFGPITVRYEKETEPKKVWVCIFTCFVTRAIHLEIALNLSAELFLAAFQRFIARRGTPRTVMSDNGTNFKLAAKVISQAWTDVITSTSTQTFATDRGIKWSFIAERAPWRGGLWERLIHVVKNSLKRTIGRKLLLMDEFSTLLADVELTVNLRPLTYLSETDPMSPLRPIDFLLPYGIRSDVPIVDKDELSDPEYHVRPATREKLVSAFNKSLQRIEMFWRIWHSDYLVSLRERQRSLEFPQGRTTSSNPRVGEVVLVMEDDIPRNLWRLAVIEQLIPGRDGQIRTAKIRCGNRVTMRATNVLYPLEVTNEEQDKNQTQNIQKTKK